MSGPLSEEENLFNFWVEASAEAAKFEGKSLPNGLQERARRGQRALDVVNVHGNAPNVDSVEHTEEAQARQATREGHVKRQGDLL